MSKRLEILEKSLEKKEAELDRRFDTHFSSVRAANGQPLNDKRNGQATLSKWDRQNEAIRNQKAEIEKTKNAIEIEKGKISDTEYWYAKFPDYLKELIDSGKAKQWRKHPRMLFIEGVEKARLIFNEDTGLVSHKYVGEIPDKEQFAIFRDTFNAINLKQKA